MVARDPSAVRMHEGWFQDLWDKAEAVTSEGAALQLKEREEKQARKTPSRSPSVQRTSRGKSRAASNDARRAEVEALRLLPAVPERGTPLASPGVPPRSGEGGDGA